MTGICVSIVVFAFIMYLACIIAGIPEEDDEDAGIKK